MRPLTTESPIYSRFGDDEQLGEIVVQFVEDMPERIAQFTSALAADDRATLRSLAHQMKGAAGSHGFDELTLAAKRLELALEMDDSNDGISKAVHEFTNICGRLRAGASSE